MILTTAYEKYALKGYEFHVNDYLLKPISFQRFLKSVNDVYALLEKERSRVDRENEFLFVRADKQLKKIRLNDILYIESMENYILIHTPAGKEVVNTSLKQMLASLPGDTFIQVHRLLYRQPAESRSHRRRRTPYRRPVDTGGPEYA